MFPIRNSQSVIENYYIMRNTLGAVGVIQKHPMLAALVR